MRGRGWVIVIQCLNLDVVWSSICIRGIGHFQRVRCWTEWKDVREWISIWKACKYWIDCLSLIIFSNSERDCLSWVCCCLNSGRSLNLRRVVLDNIIKDGVGETSIDGIQWASKEQSHFITNKPTTNSLSLRIEFQLTSGQRGIGYVITNWVRDCVAFFVRST